MLLNNDHGHPLPDAPVFYSVLSKNKQELRAAARANRMMKRFHLTIPYIIACLMAYYGFFRYYPQLKTSFLGICILYYAAAYFIRWYLEPQYALFLLRHRPYYLAESDTFLFFTLYGLEDEDGKLQARDLACFPGSSDAKSRSQMTALSCVLSKTELLKIQRKKNIFRSVYMNSFSGSLPFKIRIF